MPLLTSLLVYETGVRRAEYICCFVEREHAAWALVDGARTLKRPQPGERGGGGTWLTPANTLCYKKIAGKTDVDVSNDHIIWAPKWPNYLA